MFALVMSKVNVSTIDKQFIFEKLCAYYLLVVVVFSPMCVCTVHTLHHPFN